MSRQLGPPLGPQDRPQDWTVPSSGIFFPEPGALNPSYTLQTPPPQALAHPYTHTHTRLGLPGSGYVLCRVAAGGPLPVLFLPG